MLREMWNKLLRNKILFAALNIIFGIYLIIARGHAANALCKVAGYALIATAIAYLVMYFLGHRLKNAYPQDQTQLYYAGVAGAAGLAMLWLVPRLIKSLPMLAGLALIVIGIINLTSVSRGGSFPAYSKAVPIVIIVIGAIILFNSEALIGLVAALAGVALILNGLSELDLIRRIW